VEIIECRLRQQTRPGMKAPKPMGLAIVHDSQTIRATI
jgi:hypothetical protein